MCSAPGACVTLWLSPWVEWVWGAPLYSLKWGSKAHLSPPQARAKSLQASCGKGKERMERKKGGRKNGKRKGDEIRKKRRERKVSPKGQARYSPAAPSPALVSDSTMRT